MKRDIITKLFRWLILAFILTIVGYVCMNEFEIIRGRPWSLIFVFGSGGALLVLGTALFISARRHLPKGKQRTFLLLAGGSLPAAFISTVLHNLVYGLAIHFFGANIWGEGGDEPVFFILGVVVFPALFLVGMVGSLVMMWKDKKQKSLNPR